MIHLRQLAPLCLALTLAAAPLSAQTAQSETSRPASGSSDTSTDKTAAPQQAPAAKSSAEASTSAGSGKNSPFDYRPSEEISEDAPVSFPVDI